MGVLWANKGEGFLGEEGGGDVATLALDSHMEWNVGLTGPLHEQQPIQME